MMIFLFDSGDKKMSEEFKVSDEERKLLDSQAEEICLKLIDLFNDLIDEKNHEVQMKCLLIILCLESLAKSVFTSLPLNKDGKIGCWKGINESVINCLSNHCNKHEEVHKILELLNKLHDLVKDNK